MKTPFTLTMTQTMGHLCIISLIGDNEATFNLHFDLNLNDAQDIIFDFFVPFSVTNPKVSATCLNEN